MEKKHSSNFKRALFELFGIGKHREHPPEKSKETSAPATERSADPNGEETA